MLAEEPAAIPLAGGTDLLVHWPADTPDQLPVGLADQQLLDVELGVEGFRVEDEK